MNTHSRRYFLKISSLAVPGVMLRSSCNSRNNNLPLAFSTLGCPEWDLPAIMTFAKLHGYAGVELRGLQHEMDLTKTPSFNTPGNIATTMARMKEHGLQFVDLGSSCTLHFKASEKRTENLDEGKRFIELASKISCPNVRVFPNKFIDGQSKEETLALIVSGLQELGDFAKGAGVNVLMETHGDLVHADDVAMVMQNANHPNVGVVYDIANMWVVTKVPPGNVYPKIRKWVRHLHIKDANVDGDKIDYKLLGKGQVPIFDGIDALMKDNYKGFYSFEWEKLWHPEIAGPEIALADFPVAMRHHVAKA